MEIPGIDPELLNKPLSELALPPQEDASIALKGAEALEEPKTPAGTDTAAKSEDESKVPYRRFEKFHKLAKENELAAEQARRDAEYWRSRALESQSRPEHAYQPPTPRQDIEPVYQGADWENFKALFAGADENAVKAAYRLEVQRLAAVEERAYQRAQESFDQRSQSQRQELRANREYLDDWTDEAADLIGRDLTDDEQVQLLDIMDEFSPKDEDNVIQTPLTPRQALRIYEMQHATAHQERRATRAAIAQTSSGSSGGDVTVAPAPQEENQKFNASLGWRANFRRMTGRDPGNA